MAKRDLKNLTFLVHWTVVSVFNVSGLGIYTLGMLAVYSESSRLANFLFIFLALHGLLWLILTILSFGNWATMNRALCIDNRCADRLFIKNGNWRVTFIGDCENPSMERWLESAGHNRRMTAEGVTQVNDKRVEVERSLDTSEEKGIHSDHETVTLREKLNGSTDALLGMLLGTGSAEGDRIREVVWKTAAKYNKTLIHTPIGYVGCNATAHIIHSVVCALLILAFWYIYPVIVVKSFADALNRNQQILEEL